MRAFISYSPSLAAALCLIACGPGVEEGPIPLPPASTDSATESDTGDEDGGDTETVDTEPKDWCATPTIENRSAIVVADILPGGQFVAMGNNCLLAVRQEQTGYTATVAFLSPEGNNSILSTFEATVPKVPRALVCRSSAAEKTNTAHVITSDETSSVVYEVVDEIGVWNNVFEGRKLMGARWLVRTAEPSIDKICVFGDGIYCADTSSGWMDWQEVHASTGDIVVFDMTVITCDEGWCPVAVGGKGSVFIQHNSVWTEAAVETESDLISVADSADTFAAVGNDGALIFGDSNSVFSNVIMNGADLVSLYFDDGLRFKGATKDGAVFQGEIANDNSVYICPNPTMVTGPLKDGMIISCGNVDNFMALRSDALIGSYNCAIVTV
jgi:hypothetical protein